MPVKPIGSLVTITEAVTPLTSLHLRSNTCHNTPHGASAFHRIYRAGALVTDPCNQGHMDFVPALTGCVDARP